MEVDSTRQKNAKRNLRFHHEADFRLVETSGYGQST
jgi:hypothetical protein